VAATATILEIYCVKEATGTDLAALQAVNTAVFQLIPVLGGGFNIASYVNSLPNLVAALDSARSDPDELYVTTYTGGGLANSIWPANGATNPISQGQSVAPNITVPIQSFVQNISLWDYDSASADDLLASIQVYEQEKALGVLTKLGRSFVEGSAYYVRYRVD
jgi:hypothetical protein